MPTELQTGVPCKICCWRSLKLGSGSSRIYLASWGRNTALVTVRWLHPVMSKYARNRDAASRLVCPSHPRRNLEGGGSQPCASRRRCLTRHPREDRRRASLPQLSHRLQARHSNRRNTCRPEGAQINHLRLCRRLRGERLILPKNEAVHTKHACALPFITPRSSSQTWKIQKTMLEEQSGCSSSEPKSSFESRVAATERRLPPG